MWAGLTSWALMDYAELHDRQVIMCVAMIMGRLGDLSGPDPVLPFHLAENVKGFQRLSGEALI